MPPLAKVGGFLYIRGMNNYLHDDKGNKSSLRLNLFLTLRLTLFVVAYQVITSTIDHGLIAMLLGVIFGAKNIDTHLRSKNENSGANS